jgi:hypothetical protein
MIGRKSLIAGTFFLAMTAVAGPSQTPGHPDFTGTWIFNAAQSKLQIPVPDSGVFRIDHKEPVFRLSRTFVQKGKEDTWGIDLTTGGKDVVQKSASDTTSGHLTWDGRDLVFDSTISIGTRKASNIVRYELSEDGKILTAVEKFRGPVVKYDNVWVFDKQK